MSLGLLSRVEPSDRRLILFLALGLSAFVPFFEEIHSANELSRLYLAQAIVQDGTVSIDGPLKRLGNIHDKAERDGHQYSDKAPGIAFLAVPVVWAHGQLAKDGPTLRNEVRLARFVASTLPTLMLLLLLAGFLAEHVPRRGVRHLLLVGYAFGSLATTYGILLFGHQLSAVLLFSAYLVIRRIDPTSRRWPVALAAALMSFAVVVEYQNVLLAAPLAVALGLALWRRPTLFAWALLGTLPFALALLSYHQAAFGSPWKTGYSFLTSEFKAVHAQGFMGIGRPRIEHATLSFLSAKKGLLFYSPFLLLAVPGLALLRGRDGWLHAVMIAGLSLFVCAMIYPVGGWTVGQRHLTVLVPWLLLPAGLAMTRAPWLVGGLGGLVLAGVLATGLSTIVWPHFQEQLENPFHQVAWPLYLKGYLPPSAFGVVGLSSWTVTLLLAAGTVGLVAVAVWRESRAWARAVHLALVVGLPVAWFLGTRPIGRAQDVRFDVAWIEKVYEPDPLRPPRR